MSEGSGIRRSGSTIPPIDPRRRAVSHALQSIRNSIERQSPRDAAAFNISEDQRKSSIIKIEGIRYIFSSRSRIAESRNPELLDQSLREVRTDLAKLLDDVEFVDSTLGIRFRYTTNSEEKIEQLANDSAMQVPEAIIALIEAIDELIVPDFLVHNSADFVALARIVPNQKVAPAQFSIHAGRLAVVRQSANSAPEDRKNIDASREALLKRGEILLEELSRSNCDRRLLEHVRELQSGLSEEENIIQLGLMNIGCEAMCKAFEAELPDALRGMIEGQTQGIGMYVAQFPEWQHFSEKAALAELNQQDIRQISETANALVKGLLDNPDIADPAVPKTISALMNLISDPASATKRAAFAVLRTIENLIAKAFQYGGMFLEKTAAKSIDDLSTAASKAVVVTLMTVALGSAIGLSPIAAKIGDTSWMKTAAEIVQKQIGELAK